MPSTVRSFTFPRALFAPALILILAALAFLAVPRAHAAKGMEVAVEDDPVFVDQAYYNRETALQQAALLGATRIRVNIGWASAMFRQRNLRFPPPVGHFDFSKVDSLIDAAARYGMRVQITLTGPAPAFATGNRRVGVYQPKAQYFAKFASAAAAHFRGRVDRYGIWNEPNYVGWIAPLRQQGSIYRSLYVSAYSAIKRADPRAQVLIGETAPYSIKRLAQSPIAFLRSVTCVDGNYRRVGGCSGPKTLRADGYAHHPYDFKHAPNAKYPGADNATLGTTKNLTRALDKLKKAGVLKPNHGSHMPLYFTEYGYFASGKRRVADSKRAPWLRQAFQIALRTQRVKEMLQYLLVQPPTKLAAGAFFDLSILTSSGKPLSPFTSLQDWARQMQLSRQIFVTRPPLVLPPAPPGDSPAPRR
jgi:hypothetical protein